MNDFLGKLRIWFNRNRFIRLFSEEIFYIFENNKYSICIMDCGYCGEITTPRFIIPKSSMEINMTNQDRLRLRCNCEIPRHSKDIRKFNVKYI